MSTHELSLTDLSISLLVDDELPRIQSGLRTPREPKIELVPLQILRPRRSKRSRSSRHAKRQFVASRSHQVSCFGLGDLLRVSTLLLVLLYLWLK